MSIRGVGGSDSRSGSHSSSTRSAGAVVALARVRVGPGTAHAVGRSRSAGRLHEQRREPDPDGASGSLGGKSLDGHQRAELEKLNEQRNDDRVEADKQRWELRSPLHWFENHNPKNSRAWLVVDPPDGRIPPQTAEAQGSRGGARAGAHGRGDADSYEDRSLYDRCITRGLPGSMMPAIYGNSYRDRAGPGLRRHLVRDGQRASRHPARRPSACRRRRCGAYMGDARGHFEGDTLVIETTNFTDKVPYRGSSENLQLTERFTRAHRASSNGRSPSMIRPRGRGRGRSR